MLGIEGGVLQGLRGRGHMEVSTQETSGHSGLTPRQETDQRKRKDLKILIYFPSLCPSMLLPINIYQVLSLEKALF